MFSSVLRTFRLVFRGLGAGSAAGAGTASITLPIVQALGAAQSAVTGEKAASIIRRPGADAVHLTAYGMPCVAFGPGGRMHPDARGGSMHAVGEHVLIDDCVVAARIYLAMALDLCSRKAA